MLLIGLTGSIGMGKTETAKMFARLGLPVYDADAAIHAIYAPGGAAVEPVGAAFPGVVRNGAVDRNELSKHVVGDAEAMRKLERITHPLVGAEQRRFLHEMEEAGHWAVVLDIPLIFETGGEKRVDIVVVVSAPEEVQRERVLARPGMTEEKYEKILARQVPDKEKRARADFVIDTSKGLDAAFEQVKTVVAALKNQDGKVWAATKAKEQEASKSGS
jgi:dephospho-CoA kinase